MPLNPLSMLTLQCLLTKLAAGYVHGICQDLSAPRCSDLSSFIQNHPPGMERMEGLSSSSAPLRIDARIFIVPWQHLSKASDMACGKEMLTGVTTGDGSFGSSPDPSLL
ncbi:hypothetical protein Nepgr_024071 [Nepenthes gracilis]|uniref:Uncharacterized protein n=1 Tax=Nepenthes gracilis TaxID=150966 RepID=A0AAD3XYF8_NEPGR|nr:hypothetical protein Nepgr_024071 [Nepenthes gracilis]